MRSNNFQNMSFDFLFFLFKGWRGFPIKGIGKGAQVPNPSSTSGDCESALEFGIGTHQWCVSRDMTDFCPNRPGSPLVCTIDDGEPRYVRI